MNRKILIIILVVSFLFISSGSVILFLFRNKGCAYDREEMTFNQATSCNDQDFTTNAIMLVKSVDSEEILLELNYWSQGDHFSRTAEIAISPVMIEIDNNLIASKNLQFVKIKTRFSEQKISLKDFLKKKYQFTKIEIEYKEKDFSIHKHKIEGALEAINLSPIKGIKTNDRALSAEYDDDIQKVYSYSDSITDILYRPWLLSFLPKEIGAISGEEALEEEYNIYKKVESELSSAGVNSQCESLKQDFFDTDHTSEYTCYLLAQMIKNEPESNYKKYENTFCHLNYIKKYFPQNPENKLRYDKNDLLSSINFERIDQATNFASERPILGNIVSTYANVKSQEDIFNISPTQINNQVHERIANEIVSSNAFDISNMCSLANSAKVFLSSNNNEYLKNLLSSMENSLVEDPIRSTSLFEKKPYALVMCYEAFKFSENEAIKNLLNLNLLKIFEIFYYDTDKIGFWNGSNYTIKENAHLTKILIEKTYE